MNGKLNQLLFLLFLLPASVVSAQNIDCTVSLATYNQSSFKSGHYPRKNQLNSKFFHIQFSSYDLSATRLESFECITGKQIKDPSLKGELCLIITSGYPIVQNSSVNTATVDKYFLPTRATPAVSIEISHNSLVSSRYLNTKSEFPIGQDPFRLDVTSGRGGLASVTVTCQRD